MTNYDEIKPVLRIGAKDNFVLFCYYMDHEFFKARPFLKEIAISFQDIADGKIKSLSVSLPPRSGKSYITTLFCAWLLGKYPSESVMRNTCTATLYNKLSYETRDIVRSEKFSEIFPNVRMSDDKSNVNGWNTNKAKMVSYFGAGVGGTIIGFGASKVAITDDLFRNMEDAMSEVIRDKTLSWKSATHDSRKESGCAEIDIGTRWVRDDVIGTNSDNGRYDKEIIVPALIEKDGELVSFCEAVKTTEEFLQIKDQVPDPIWQAEYMQRPVDVEGRLFEHLRMFTDREAILKASEGCLAYIDVADEGSDYLCALIGHVVGKEVFITDALYTKGNTDITIPLCAEMLNGSNASYCRVETNGMGAIFIKELRKKVTNTKVIGINNRTHKATRIFLSSAYVLRKFLFLEADKGQYHQFIQALKGYMHEGRNKNDDAPDAVTGLAQMFQGFMPQLDKED